ncbi:MAG: ATP-dependent Clp protease proteolytic subunit [Bacteroidales bacterium]
MSTPTYNIDIDGYIGDGSYSKEYVKSVLDQNKGKAVTMRMSSEGGSLKHGLGIADRIGEHGNVQVSMFGFNASAATVATLKCKKVSMASNSFYLIHKVMNPVMVFSMMNADEMRSLIAELETNIEENDKIDRVIAQMYCDKTGKSETEILDLMKKGGWLTAQEAKDWGFVDEVFQSVDKVNMKTMESKLLAFGLPVNGIDKENLFTNQINNQMKKQFLKVNTAIGVDKLESDKDGAFLNEVQIEALDTKIDTLEKAVEAEKANVVTEKDAITAVETRATTAEETVATQATKITELETQISNLKKGAGDKTKTVTNQTDDADDKSGEKKDAFMNTVENARKLYDLLPD